MARIPTLDLASVFALREGKDLSPFNYSYKLAGSSFGMDVAIADLDVDPDTMSMWVPIADGNKRDGVGDLLDVTGINTSRHIRNPVVLYDHGKEISTPIARAREDPKDIDSYTFKVDVMSKTAGCRAYFYQGEKDCALTGSCRPGTHSQFCAEIFDMASKGFIGAGSIGYQVLDATNLPADYFAGTPQGLHLKSVLMLENSLVVLPANDLTVGKSYLAWDYIQKAITGGRINGRQPTEYFKKAFQPYAPRRSATVRGGFTKSQTMNKPPRYGRKAEGSQTMSPMPDMPQPSNKQSQSDDGDELFSAKALRWMHAKAMEMLSDANQMLPHVEDEPTRDLIQDAMQSQKMLARACKNLWSSRAKYKNLDPLGGDTEAFELDDDLTKFADAEENPGIVIPTGSMTEPEPSPEESLEGLAVGPHETFFGGAPHGDPKAIEQQDREDDRRRAITDARGFLDDVTADDATTAALGKGLGGQPLQSKLSNAPGWRSFGQSERFKAYHFHRKLLDAAEEMQDDEGKCWHKMVSAAGFFHSLSQRHKTFGYGDEPLRPEETERAQGVANDLAELDRE